MTLQLCDTNSTVNISKETMADLDIFDLCRSFFLSQALEDNEIEIFIKTYLSADISEIQRRSEIIGGLSKNPESKSLIASIIAECKRMSHNISAISRSPRPLMACTGTLHALKAYISSINYLEKLFIYGSTPAINEIAEFIRKEKESAFYAQVQNSLQYADNLIKPLDSVTLAVNMSEAGQAAQIAVTDINGHMEKLTGIFGGVRDNINSLCDAAPIKQRGQLAYLEDYIIAQVEKQWSPQLNAALRAFKKISIEKLHGWHNWLMHIKLYHKGLLLLDKLNPLGCAGCRPEPCIDGFINAEGMLYPHMVLSELLPIPQTFKFSTGDAVIITGANNSGKTSVLKAFAQNCILAQLGFWIPAKFFKFSPFKQWSSVFSAGEDDEIRASRYQQEAERMSMAVETADNRTCLLFNEPFTSTNPAEAAPLLCEITASLYQKGVTLIFVTHIYDVYKLLRQEGIVRMRSYVTAVGPSGGKNYGRVGWEERAEHCDRLQYKLEEKEPDGLSYAKSVAKEQDFCLESLIGDPDEVSALEEFIAGGGHIA